MLLSCLQTMRLVLKNSGRANGLKSDLHAILSQGALDISAKALTGGLDPTEELESHTEMQCNPPPTAFLTGVVGRYISFFDIEVGLNLVGCNSY